MALKGQAVRKFPASLRSNEKERLGFQYTHQNQNHQPKKWKPKGQGSVLFIHNIFKKSEEW
jgi:hypothetical protein